MYLTVGQVAERYQVSVKVVRGWIRTGELTAMDVGKTKASAKPRWRVKPEAMAEFEALRTPNGRPKPRGERKYRPKYL